MKHTRHGGPIASVFVFLLLAAVRPLAAQECPLEGTEPTNRAASLIQQGREAEDAEARLSHYQDALALLQEALVGQPDDPATLWLLGELNISLGDFAAADSMLDRLVEVQPACEGRAAESRRNGWVELHNSGVRALGAGDTARALKALDGATVLYEDARSYNIAAFIHESLNEPEEAIELYRKAMGVAREVEPLRAATANLVRLLLAADRIEEALTVYSQHFVGHAEDRPALIDYAVVLSDAGERDSSRAIFSRLLAREGQTYDEWYELGLGLIRVEGYADAIVALERARELEPYRKDAMIHLLDARMEVDRFADALPLADTLVTWYPYDASNYTPLATCLAKMNRSVEALTVLQNAEALPLEFRSVHLTSEGSNRYVLGGEVVGHGRGAGQTATVPFEFLGPDGDVVATRELSLEVPAAGAAEPFHLVVETESPVAGYRYQPLEE